MPKVTVTFNLPEESSEHKMHMKAGDYHSLIWDWTQLLRSKTKYGDGKPVTWEDVSDEWWNLCKDEEIDPYAD